MNSPIPIELLRRLRNDIVFCRDAPGAKLSLVYEDSVIQGSFRVPIYRLTEVGHAYLDLQTEIERLEEVVRGLRAEIDRLTPRWQEGEPPTLEPVWREDKVEPHIVFTLPGGRFMSFGEASEPWGTARWAPISRPA